MSDDDKSGAQSGVRFDVLREGPTEQAPPPMPTYERKESPYAALDQSHAHVETQASFDKNIRGSTDIDHRETDAPPMQRDAVDREQWFQQSRSSGGELEYTPHGPRMHYPEHRQPDEKKLEFDEDRERSSGERGQSKTNEGGLQFYEDVNREQSQDRDR